MGRCAVVVGMITVLFAAAPLDYWPVTYAHLITNYPQAEWG